METGMFFPQTPNDLACIWTNYKCSAVMLSWWMISVFLLLQQKMSGLVLNPPFTS